MVSFIRVICIFLLLVCTSCSSDEPSEYKVTVEVTASSDANVLIQGIGELDGKGVYFQHHIKRTFSVQRGYDQIIIRCDNPKALLAIKIWVNKKLVKDIIGNSYMDITNYLP